MNLIGVPYEVKRVDCGKDGMPEYILKDAAGWDRWIHVWGTDTKELVVGKQYVITEVAKSPEPIPQERR